MRCAVLSAWLCGLWALPALAQTLPVALPGPVTASAAPARVDEGATPHAERPIASVRIAIREGHFEAALVSVDALLARVPHDDELRTTRSRLLYWLGRYAEADNELKPLRTRHPADQEMLELDGQIHLAQNHLERALQLFRALEAAGDTRTATHQRVIDLELQLDKAEDVVQSLRLGGTLTEEQRLKLALIQHPIYLDAIGLTTLHSGAVWKHFEATGGYRISPRLTVLGGGIYEMRLAESAYAGKLEAYASAGPVSGMLYFSGSPSATFLATYDVRGEVGVALAPWLGVNLYGRYAHYVPVDLGMFGPSFSVTKGAWTLTPGYLGSIARPGNPINHTGFFKIRWQPTAPSALLLWTYVGQDPAFTERFQPTVTAAYGLTVLFGVDHWWNGRFGTRVSISHTQPFANTDPYTEFALVLRGRL